MKSKQSISSQDKQLIQDVISLYTKYGRHTLPWREKITPYRILVSELMLQQTQVIRVIPKFKLWMKEYPTLAKLSQASLKDILVVWQGLGYQRRAKALHTIAKTVQRIPRSFEELCDLPGVGTYTASAIGAFAYNEFSHPVLETNIKTVLIEHYHPRTRSVTDETLYKHLRRLEMLESVQTLGARAWYYALMDFGAHLKSKAISHNSKVKGYTKQSSFKGSLRELRAKTLFAILNHKELPEDTRLQEILNALTKEGYIKKSKGAYTIV